MTTIARRQPERDIQAEILWFEDLRTVIREGDYAAALKAINAAIKMLKRERENERRN